MTAARGVALGGQQEVAQRVGLGGAVVVQEPEPARREAPRRPGVGSPGSAAVRLDGTADRARRKVVPVGLVEDAGLGEGVGQEAPARVGGARVDGDDAVRRVGQVGQRGQRRTAASVRRRG